MEQAVNVVFEAEEWSPSYLDDARRDDRSMLRSNCRLTGGSIHACGSSTFLVWWRALVLYYNKNFGLRSYDGKDPLSYHCIIGSDHDCVIGARRVSGIHGVCA